MEFDLGGPFRELTEEEVRAMGLPIWEEPWFSSIVFPPDDPEAIWQIIPPREGQGPSLVKVGSLAPSLLSVAPLRQNVEPGDTQPVASPDSQSVEKGQQSSRGLLVEQLTNEQIQQANELANSDDPRIDLAQSVLSQSRLKRRNPSYVKKSLDEPSLQASQARTANTPNQEEEPPEGDAFELSKEPVLAVSPLYGLIGEIAEAIYPHTEADFAAVLLHLFVAVGNAIGHGPFLQIEATRHYTNLNVCFVGKTSRGRKGSSWNCARWIMEQVDPDWTANRIKSGLSSGEGLIHAVRDPVTEKQNVKSKGQPTGKVITVTTDFGVTDKRLLVIEEEFVRTLNVMRRDNNTLSAQLRQAWDHGKLQVLVKDSPYSATGAHISVIGHITQLELSQALKEGDFFNGFANRFFWAYVKRSKLLPEGTPLEASDFAPLVDRLRQVIGWAKRVEEMERSQQALSLWKSVYPELSAEVEGKYGSAVGRAEAQVLRMSMIFALVDHKRIIEPTHLQGALDLWNYCEASAKYLFLKRIENRHAKKILDALRQTPEGMTRTEISAKLFNRNLSSSKLDDALSYLKNLRLVHAANEQTDGRDRERWSFTNPS